MSAIVSGLDVKLGATSAVQSIIARHGESHIKVVALAVTFSGNGAFTRYNFEPGKFGGKNLTGAINLPWLEDTAKVARADADKVSAYWIHEALHIFYTDFTAFEKFCSTNSVARKHLVNALEDVRIEARCISRAAVPGFGTLCARLINSLVHESLFPPVVKKTKLPARPAWSPNNLNDEAWTLAVFGRAIVGGLAVDGFDKLWDASNADLRAKWTAVFAELKLAQSTADVIAIVEKHWPKNAPDTVPPQPPPGVPTNPGPQDEGDEEQGSEPQDGNPGPGGKPEDTDEDTDDGDQQDTDEGEDTDGAGSDDSDEESEDEGGKGADGDDGEGDESDEGEGDSGDGDADGDGDGDGDTEGGESDDGEEETEEQPDGATSRAPGFSDTVTRTGELRSPHLRITSTVNKVNKTAELPTPEQLRRSSEYVLADQKSVLRDLYE